jgi:hypothetical protein
MFDCMFVNAGDLYISNVVYESKFPFRNPSRYILK